MGRFIEDVHKKILEQIPTNQTEFREELQNYIDSLWNIAPEVRRSSHTYIPYFNIMVKYIPNITELKDSDPEWWFECRDIFCDKK